MGVSFPLSLSAPAKINLCLLILGRRDDGYHNLQTAFQLLDLADTLMFTASDNLTIDGVPEVGADDNLIMRAAKLLLAHAKTSATAHIQVAKKIPMGAGLAGEAAHRAIPAATVVPVRVTAVTVQDAVQAARMVLTA